ncbi:uncharacterized protein [Hetaerina americana]|uniref:uncharacterized protein n=1 Tax=Hetaerina americana TaxID=62018 RepID=UPI003A7F3E81
MEESYLCQITWWLAVLAMVAVMAPVIALAKPLLYIYLTPRGWQVKNLIDSIPGPPHVPILGSAHDLWVSREKIMEFRNGNSRKYYPFYKVWYLGRYSVDPVGPEYVEAILRSSKHIEKGWLYDLLRPWLGEGLLTSKGDKWFTHRKLLTPAFHFKILEQFVPMFIERSAGLANKLSEKAISGEAFDIVPVISQCTLEVICESAMGIKLDHEKKEQRDYIAAIYRFGEVAHQRAITPWYVLDWLFALTPLGRENKRILAVLHSFSENVIKSKKMEYIKNKTAKAQELNGHELKPAKKKLRAFLELLIELAVEEKLLTDKEIREEVDTFMFEGHDTTSMALCYTIFMLANNPKIQEEVWKEVSSSSISGAAAADVNVEVLGNLQLLERCIKESLRMYPSVPYIARLLTEDFEMGEYNVPAGSTVNVTISGIHMNPLVYPNPEIFDPDRFLPEAVKERHPYAYIPFSAGPRNCIGQKFAMLEMKAILSSLVKRYRIIAVDKPEDVELMHDIVLRPSKGIQIKLEAREQFKMEEYLYRTVWALAAAVALVAMVPVMVILKPLVYIYLTPRGRRAKKMIDSIPGPPHLPILGNLLDIWVSRERILEYRNENCRKYFPLYKLWYLGVYMVDPVGPEYIEAILRSSKHIEKAWVYDFLRPWLGNGLLTSKGEKWFAHRKFLTPAFHFKILEQFVPMFVERSADLADKLSDKAITGEAFDVVPVISQCTLEVICESAMGIKLDREKKEQRDYIAAIYRFGEVLYQRATTPWYTLDWVFGLTPLGREHKRILAVLHSFSENVIKSKKSEYINNKTARAKELNGSMEKPSKKKLKAFLELLIELAVDEKLLTDEEIREEVDTFMFEGHDTTSMAICYTIFMLANNPKIQEEVWKEVESSSISGVASSGVNVEGLGDLQLLERCIKETLRLYPSVPYIARLLAEDFEMGEYKIPAYTMINVAITGIHMNPLVYPDPKVFDPDRFLPEAVKARHPYAYIPFSAGPRNCIGQRYAMLEMKAVLSTLVKNYRIIAVDKPENFELMHDMVLRPSKGLRIRLEPREKMSS